MTAPCILDGSCVYGYPGPSSNVLAHIYSRYHSRPSPRDLVARQEIKQALVVTKGDYKHCGLFVP